MSNKCEAIGSEKIINLFLKDNYQKIKNNNFKILIIGSGNGYLEKKLLSINNKSIIDSTDIENFQSKEIKNKINQFIKLDLNKFENKQIKSKYDLIICFEVIEHINNPWTLLELFKEKLNKNGEIYLSSPNPLNIYSRFHYLVNGRFLYFYKKDMFDRYEHTNPIFHWELLKIVNYTKLKIQKIHGVKYPIFNNKFFIFNLLIYLFSIAIRLRHSIINTEEVKKKDFNTILYSSQTMYTITHKNVNQK